MQKIMIIEDDIWIAESLELYLENSGFKVILYHEWNGAIDEIQRHNPDLIILDINLPWMDGIQIAKELRFLSSIPIIMLTARSWELDKIAWFEIWADDYIAKPFSPRELLARINTILRRISFNEEIETQNIIKYWNIEIDKEKKLVKIFWSIAPLTSNEYEILEKIFNENWKLVSRETLMTEVIGYDNYLYDRTIDTHIKNLRKKLGNKDLIITVRWSGYRLNK